MIHGLATDARVPIGIARRIRHDAGAPLITDGDVFAIRRMHLAVTGDAMLRGREEKMAGWEFTGLNRRLRRAAEADDQTCQSRNKSERGGQDKTVSGLAYHSHSIMLPQIKVITAWSILHQQKRIAYCYCVRRFVLGGSATPNFR